MQSFSREGLRRMYLRRVQEKKVEKITALLSESKKQILSCNLEGGTRCTIHLDADIEDEIFHNLLYRLRELFKDVDFEGFQRDGDAGQVEKYIEVDWTFPTYVVGKKDYITDED
jgi:hypothetical protein